MKIEKNQFEITLIGYGRYRVTYTSKNVRNKWEACLPLSAVSAVLNEENPTQRSMEILRKACKPLGRAKRDVYRNMLWRYGTRRHWELYKYVSSEAPEKLGRSETSTLVFKRGDVIPNTWHKNTLEVRHALC